MGGFSFSTFLGSLPVVSQILGDGYRPTEWALQTPQLVSLTAQVPVTAEALAQGGFFLGSKQIVTNNNNSFQPVTYFFDAVFREDHLLRVVPTRHPVQNGAALTDHAYVVPARVVLDVGFSDAMDSYKSGQYGGYATKSIGAFVTFQQLQSLRFPLTLSTRLNKYENMLIEEIHVHEDETTFHALKATVIFEQVLIGEVQTVPLSARSNQSNSSAPGASSVQAIPASILKLQNAAGQWSSK